MWPYPWSRPTRRKRERGSAENDTKWFILGGIGLAVIAVVLILLIRRKKR